MTETNKPAQPGLLRRIAGPPTLSAESKAQTARYLNLFLPVIMVLLGVYVVFTVVDRQFKLNDFDYLIVGLIVILGGLWVLTRRGYVMAAATAVLFVTFFAMVIAASKSDGLFDGAFTALTVLVVLAGLLIDWKTAFVMGGLSIAAAWWLYRLNGGTSVTLPPNAPFEYAAAVTAVFVILTLVTYLLISSLRRALGRSQISEQMMREQNSELAQMRNTLEDRVAERTLQLRAAADVGNIAASILNPDQLLSEIVTVIAERFGFYYAAIFTLDRTGAYLVLREATGEAGQTLKERGHRLRVSMDSMVGYTALEHQPRVAQNAGQDMIRFANPLLPDTQSEAALPLLSGQDVIGALDVQSTRLNAFDEGTLAALQTMAAQVAIALQNAQSFANLQKALEYTSRQYELSRTIFTAQTPDEAYLTLGQVFAIFADIDRIQLLRVVERDANHQPAVYELAIEWDILGGAQIDTGLSYTAAEAPLAALVDESETVIVRDANEARVPTATRERLADVNAQAAILVPLYVGAEYGGFVAALAEQPRDFTTSEVRLLKSVMEQLGLVLANLQLTGEMRVTNERVSLLNRRLSGEAWDSYQAGRARPRIESGYAEVMAAEHPLQVPIVVRGETIGAFNVADNNPEREWKDDELSLLRTIAGEVALAMENARLIEQTQRAAQREKDIAVAADQIHRSMNLDTILNTALGEITRITGIENVAIQFGTLTHSSGNGRPAATP